MSSVFQCTRRARRSSAPIIIAAMRALPLASRLADTRLAFADWRRGRPVPCCCKTMVHRHLEKQRAFESVSGLSNSTASSCTATPTVPFQLLLALRFPPLAADPSRFATVSHLLVFSCRARLLCSLGFCNAASCRHVLASGLGLLLFNDKL